MFYGYKEIQQNSQQQPISAAERHRLRAAVRDIISFKLHPGTRISENAISQELSISRSPVKTALEKLVDRRFAKITNNRYYVSDFDPEYYKEICDFTMMIEPFAAKKAARNIKPEQLEELYRISDRLTALYQEAYVSGKDFGFTKLLDQEMAFHYGVVKASGNGLISSLYEEHKYEVWRFRGCLLYSRPEGFSTLSTPTTASSATFSSSATATLPLPSPSATSMSPGTASNATSC